MALVRVMANIGRARNALRLLIAGLLSFVLLYSVSVWGTALHVLGDAQILPTTEDQPQECIMNSRPFQMILN